MENGVDRDANQRNEPVGTDPGGAPEQDAAGTASSKSAGTEDAETYAPVFDEHVEGDSPAASSDEASADAAEVGASSEADEASAARSEHEADASEGAEASDEGSVISEAEADVPGSEALDDEAEAHESTAEEAVLADRKAEPQAEAEREDERERERERVPVPVLESVPVPVPVPARESETVARLPDPFDSSSSYALRRRSHVAPALIPLDHIDEDDTFRVREENDDVTLLATDIARVGQLFPVELRLRPPDRFQIVSGFRRVSALRFLQRDKVLARLHVDLSDDDAQLMSLAAAIHAKPVTAEELAEAKDRLEAEGRLNAAARDMLEKALAPEDNLAPEEVGGEEEVDADELASDVAGRLSTLNQELALLADVFESLDEGRRAELLMQLRYSSELVAYLEEKK